MTAVEIIGVPTSVGAYGVGPEDAPRAIREAGLSAVLTERGVDVVDGGDLPVTRFAPDPGSRNAQNLDAVVAVANSVAARIADVARSGRLALVVGGDCTVTIGVVAGIAAAGREPAVAYVDGDLDLSTPATTRSGVLDAMVVAHMLDLDGAASALAGVGGRRPLANGSRLAMVGFEDIDSTAQVALDGRNVHQFAAEDVRADPVDVARRVRGALGTTHPLVVHFDVDVIDSIDSPLAHFPHFNSGVTLADATACLQELCRHESLAALVVTEVNPQHDPDQVYVPRLVDAVGDMIGGRP